MPFKAGTRNIGRPKGATNRATRDLRAALELLAVDAAGRDAHIAKLHALTKAKDPVVAIKALTLVLAYRFGRPKEALEVTMPEPVTVRYVAA